jgi:type IV pilus assembly protein PilY1
MKEVIDMKYFKVLFWVLLLCLFFALNTYARDTDLYVGSESTIEPNILIIFDTSGSMAWAPASTTFCEYNRSYSYPQPTDPTKPNIDPAKVYVKQNDVWIPLKTFKDTVSAVGCSKARKGLDQSGLYTGFTNADGSPTKKDKECKKDSYTIATGNYLRWLYADAVLTDSCRPKIDIAKDTVKGFVDTITGVKLGLMVFNSNSEGGHLVNDIKSLEEVYNGTAGNNKTHRENLLADITALVADGWTPLAETLYEAGLYFRGAASYFNSGKTYTSPVEYYCQKNYVILMTDGVSTEDANAILNTNVGDWDGDQREPPCPKAKSPYPPCYYVDNGSDYLDDVAKKHYDEDFHSMQGKQNIVTYTIGFELDMSVEDQGPKAKDLLQRTANLSHGKFFTTSGSRGLTDAFANILNEVLRKTSSFVAPIVPVSKMERTTAGDKIYLAFFSPNQSGMWSGNLKKYGVAQEKNPSQGIEAGDILDVSGSKALDSNGEFFPSSRSYWTTSSSDGGDVQIGGVGQVLQNRTEARKIYTLLPGDASDEDTGPDANTSFDLTNSWNAFTTDNTRLTTTTLGVSTTTEKDNLINFVRGIDAYDDNVNGVTTEKREWMLGSFLHSRPYIIHYADRTVIYAGANDGMLHAFNDADGQELWAFIPPSLLGRLKELHTETPGVFVDGSPKAYVTYASDGITVTKAILIFGLRRGGNYYYALDVTNPTVPKYLYRIYKGKKTGFTSYFMELGQTWSTPVIGKVAYGTGEKWVAIFGGGYDEGQDVVSNPPSDDVGRGIYMADLLTGNYVWATSYYGGTTSMTHCFPSDVAALDLNGDGRIDRLYVGDAKGRMWKFNLVGSDSGNWTAKLIFASSPGNSEKNKIFYPPDVTFEKDSSGEYELLFFGTGDRENPNGAITDKDILVALKDKDVFKNVTDLIEVTGFYSLSASEQTTKIGEITAGYGWYIKLDRKEGEKCLATPAVYAKTAYFTTFSPSTEAILDACFVGEGTASIYAMNYATGEAVFNLDLTEDNKQNQKVINAADRSKIIGSAIPSGAILTVIGGRVTAYVGVGGGVFMPTLSGTRSLFPVTWKLVF